MRFLKPMSRIQKAPAGIVPYFEVFRVDIERGKFSSVIPMSLRWGNIKRNEDECIFTCFSDSYSEIMSSLITDSDSGGSVCTVPPLIISCPSGPITHSPPFADSVHRSRRRRRRRRPRPSNPVSKKCTLRLLRRILTDLSRGPHARRVMIGGRGDTPRN